MSRRFSFAAWLAAFALLALSMTPARPEAVRPQAVAPAVPIIAPQDGVATLNCWDARNAESCVTVFRSGRINPHVITVPQSTSEQDRAAADARDQRWAARCRPTIRQDRYGMPRYSYAAPGCEFGRVD